MVDKAFVALARAMSSISAVLNGVIETSLIDNDHKIALGRMVVTPFLQNLWLLCLNFITTVLPGV